jgi:hypothetical protein
MARLFSPVEQHRTQVHCNQMHPFGLVLAMTVALASADLLVECMDITHF